jgi:dUTP pyrophosphatase
MDSNSIKEQIKELKSLLETEGISEDTKDQTQVAINLLEGLRGVNEIRESDDTKFKIPIKYINKSNNENPKYAQEGDSGFDFRANLETPITLKPLERVLVPTGLFFELPMGYELQIRPRSGMAYKHGITVLNTPGTVDTAYRGEIKVLLINLSNEEYTIEHGDRVAQGVVASRVSTEFGDLLEVMELSETVRGEGGFGSTGKK